MVKVLLIDDNQKFGNLLVEKFTKKFEIEHKLTIEAAINCSFVPDVLLLDVNLGDKHAYNYISLINKTFNVPIIAISSELERQTKYLMFENGVVDYIEKPIDFELLQMKLNNLNILNHNELIFNQLSLNTNNLMLNKQIKLTKNEFIVLKHLILNSEELVSRKTLLRLLWENETFIEDTALNNLLSRLRKKIDVLELNLQIKTIRNKGIVFGIKC